MNRFLQLLGLVLALLHCGCATRQIRSDCQPRRPTAADLCKQWIGFDSFDYAWTLELNADKTGKAAYQSMSGGLCYLEVTNWGANQGKIAVYFKNDASNSNSVLRLEGECDFSHLHVNAHGDSPWGGTWTRGLTLHDRVKFFQKLKVVTDAALK